jgi:HPt (histidine-containing phosphotransfer) domain-containing protein
MTGMCAEAVVFDRAAFLDRIMGDEELARKIMEAFLADIPVQIDELDASVAAGDCRLSERLAHRIAGVAANLGGESLSKIAFEMEKTGKAGDREALGIRMPELMESFVRLREVMEKEIGKTVR